MLALLKIPKSCSGFWTGFDQEGQDKGRQNVCQVVASVQVWCPQLLLFRQHLLLTSLVSWVAGSACPKTALLFSHGKWLLCCRVCSISLPFSIVQLLFCHNPELPNPPQIPALLSLGLFGESLCLSSFIERQIIQTFSPFLTQLC